MPEIRNNSSQSEGNVKDTVERLWGIINRRRWWFLCSSCCISIAVAAVAMKLPNRYESRATIFAVQQQVSQRYVDPESTSTISGAIEAMKLQVLSADHLTAVIEEFGLYGRLAKQRPELLVDQMRKDIDIRPLEVIPGQSDSNAFAVAFTASNPRLAHDVTGRLASLFIEQNAKTQGHIAANTTKFLSEQLEGAKQRLTEQEDRLQAFKTSNVGELPEQQQANLVALTQVESRLEALAADMAQVRQRQQAAESSLKDLVARLHSERAGLLAQYTERHPAIVKKDQEIKKLQELLDRLRAGSIGDANIQVGDPQVDTAVAEIVGQAEANAAELGSLSKEQGKLKEDSQKYQTRLSLVPSREQQLSEILRDDDLLRQDYATLEKQKLQSELAASLEENQEGQQFRLADSPTLPVRPSAPNRLKISLTGVAGGILLGGVLAFLVDARDGSFHDEKSLAQAFGVPVVLGIPLALSDFERRARRSKGMFEWVVGSLLVLAAFAAEVYVFLNG